MLAWATTFVGLLKNIVSSLIPALHSGRGRQDFR
jgi:hypothetical protein